jgi:glycosyltransferase involved in cell wall biosynthesis
MKLKVAYDHQAFATQHVGGISRYVCELARRVHARDDMTGRIVAPIHFNLYLRDFDPGYCGVYLPPIRRTGRLIRALNNFSSRALFGINRPDILHETYYQPTSLAPRGTRTVLTVYDMVHERFGTHFRSDDETSRNKQLAVARADRIVCISESTQKDLLYFFDVPAAKTVVIYLGFTPMLSGTSNLLTPQRPFILYVGHRGHWKNFERLLTAYASCALLRKNYVLALFGGGPLGAPERNRMSELGLSEDSVIYYSGTDETLASLYKSAALFVYPSLCEGFGLPPLEAMNLGCPVAASKAASIPEVVGDAAQMFDPENVEDMQDAMRTVLNDQHLSAELVRRGRERAERFSWDKCANETISLYRQLAN